VTVSVPQSTRRKDVRDFVSFFLTALLGASVNFVSQIFYRRYFDYVTSVLLGYLTATVVSFVPTKLFAFSAKNTGSTGREMIKFLIIAIVALGVQVLVAKYTLDWVANPLFPKVSIFLREKGSHVVGMGLSFLTNFFGHKLLTFRSTGVYDRIKSKTGRSS
jgi:putative flippase GtrA